MFITRSSVSARAENELFFFVELVTVAELVVSAPPRSLQPAEPATAIISLSFHFCAEDQHSCCIENLTVGNGI